MLELCVGLWWSCDAMTGHQHAEDAEIIPSAHRKTATAKFLVSSLCLDARLAHRCCVRLRAAQEGHSPSWSTEGNSKRGTNLPCSCFAL